MVVLYGNHFPRKDRGLAFGQDLPRFGVGVKQDSKRMRYQGRFNQNQNHHGKESLTEIAQHVVDVLTANGCQKQMY